MKSVQSTFLIQMDLQSLIMKSELKINLGIYGNKEYQQSILNQAKFVKQNLSSQQLILFDIKRFYAHGYQSIDHFYFAVHLDLVKLWH